MTMIFMGEFALMHFNTDPKYNPVQAAEEMETVAKFAAQCLKNKVALEPMFVGKCLEQLRDADDWLARHVTSFDLPPRETVIEAAENQEPIPEDLLIEVLERTVIEVLQINKLLELRGERLRGR